MLTVICTESAKAGELTGEHLWVGSTRAPLTTKPDLDDDTTPPGAFPPCRAADPPATVGGARVGVMGTRIMLPRFYNLKNAPQRHRRLGWA